MSQDPLVQMGWLFSCSSQLHWIISSQGSYRVLNYWKSLEICPAIAGQNWKKSGKCIYVGENGKKSLENNKTSVLEEILFNSTLMFAVHHDYLCFCILKRSPLIICSITSSLQKINYCQFWKKSGKGLELYGHPKIWMNPAILIMFILYHIPAV